VWSWTTHDGGKGELTSLRTAYGPAPRSERFPEGVWKKRQQQDSWCQENSISPATPNLL
jgi:hypothetical protein